MVHGGPYCGPCSALRLVRGLLDAGQVHLMDRCLLHPECCLAAGHRSHCYRLTAAGRAKVSKPKAAKCSARRWPAEWFPRVAQNEKGPYGRIRKEVP